MKIGLFVYQLGDFSLRFLLLYQQPQGLIFLLTPSVPLTIYILILSTTSYKYVSITFSTAKKYTIHFTALVSQNYSINIYLYATHFSALVSPTYGININILHI